MLLTTRSTLFSLLATNRDRNLRAWSDARISSNRSMTSSIVGRFSGSSCTISSMRGCMNSTPWNLCGTSQIRSTLGNCVSSTTHLEEIFSNEIAHVVDVCWERVAGLIRLVELWYRSIPAKDRWLSGRQVCGVVLPRYPEVDEIVLRWMCRSCMMFGGMREIAIPFNDTRMIWLWVKRFRIHHDVLVHAVPVLCQATIMMAAGTAIPMSDVMTVHELQALKNAYRVSPTVIN